MKNLGNSSANPTVNHHEQSRKTFALTGRSVTLDPRSNAVRPDLADVRLAEFVFAPHYAAPVARIVTSDAPLMTSRAGDADTMATVARGETFEMLDLVGGTAWGVAPAHGLVGYVVAGALETAPGDAS